MTSIRFRAKVRRVGNTMAVFIPARYCKAVRLREGVDIEVRLETEVPEILGLLKGVIPYEPFTRDDLY